MISCAVKRVSFVLVFIAIFAIFLVINTHLFLEESARKNAFGILKQKRFKRSLGLLCDEKEKSSVKNTSAKDIRISLLLTSLDKKNLAPTVIFGKEFVNKSIIIGIPSVRRQLANYLYLTLTSLFENIYPINEDRVGVVVFLAEDNPYFTASEGRKIHEMFTREVDKGILQVISPGAHAYPDFNKLPSTFEDPPNRVKWRAKEVYDAAYLMNYCRDKAKFYLMMEDDITFSKGFIEAIKEFIDINSGKEYSYLSFSSFQSIGKVFKMTDVPAWVNYFFIFYALKPIDWLINDFVYLQTCTPEMSYKKCSNQERLMKPQSVHSLFQHIGEQSSLFGKKQRAFDRAFVATAAENPHINPKAEISSSIKNDTSSIEKWYKDSGGMNAFYLMLHGKKDDYITFKFGKEQNISKILVKTRNKEQKLEKNSASLEYLARESFEYTQCDMFDHNGVVDCRFHHQPMTGIRIYLNKYQKNIRFDSILVI